MSSKNTKTSARILEAACNLLETEGPAAVRMADIARRAGISRQALYLHYPSRAELLIATTRHIDALNKVGEKLAGSRTASSGIGRLDAYVSFWAAYIPAIYGVGRAMIALRDTDEAAAAAWDDRMAAMREGCAAAVAAIKRDGLLIPGLSTRRATDLLWTLLSVENWAHLTRECKWSQSAYAGQMKSLARLMLTGQAR